jgi:hypothetical protein
MMKKKLKISLIIFIIFLVAFNFELIKQYKNIDIVSGGIQNISSNENIPTKNTPLSSLPGFDINTFQVIYGDISKDKNHVYIGKKIYPNFDAETFGQYHKKELIVGPLFSDKNGVYILTFDKKLESIFFDIDTAQSFNHQYFKDKNSVYFVKTYNISINKIENADPETFHVLGVCTSVEMSYAEYVADKDYVYINGKIIDGINPASFVKIAHINSSDGMPSSYSLWKDSKHIYARCGVMVKEADYDTFEYKDGRAQDKNNYYDFDRYENYAVIPKN